MATRKRPRKTSDKSNQQSSAPPPPDNLPESQEERLREAIVEKEESREKVESSRRDELRVIMMRSIVTEPLLSKVQENPQDKYEVIIVLNELYKGGIDAALKVVEEMAERWNVKYATVSHYCFACLRGEQILELAEATRRQIDEHGRAGSVIYRIWEDNDISVTLNRSLTTVKADAAQRSFRALGEDIVWAVLDSGIEATHPHFKASESPFGPIDSLGISDPLEHKDYTPLNNGALVDKLGHGTHVAGIIAGYWRSQKEEGEPVVGTEMRNESNNEPVRQREKLRTISGVAPRCRLVSMKVVADQSATGETKQKEGQGKVSWVLLAIDQIQKWNQNGKRLLVHGVNMSLGYDFDPRWFACGQSPLCVEVNRLVKSGVSVVVSAGNAGYSSVITASGKEETRYNDLSISDPGNADLAITVGSTHREMPHMYGVSYFSSRGPTGDGRMKPDLVAPGERIVSCAAGIEAEKYGTLKDGDGNDVQVLYCEQTGTSMAAPHVSGAVAAFLSVRREFIGQPERVKEIFLANTIDLRRERKFQGTGLLDVMKALQAV
jgi:serine protease AprX